MEVRLSVHCVARANARYVNKKFVLSKEHRTFAAAMRHELAKLGYPRLSGPLRVEIHTYWPRLRWLDDGGYPLGDVDATVKSTLDAMADKVPRRSSDNDAQIARIFCGIFDDDIRVVELAAFKHFDSAGHRIEVIVSPCTNFKPETKIKRQASSSSPASKSLAVGDASIATACINAGEHGPDGSASKPTRSAKHSKLRSDR